MKNNKGVMIMLKKLFQKLTSDIDFKPVTFQNYWLPEEE